MFAGLLSIKVLASQFTNSCINRNDDGTIYLNYLINLHSFEDFINTYGYIKVFFTKSVLSFLNKSTVSHNFDGQSKNPYMNT